MTQKKVLYKRPCPVCLKDIEFLQDFDYINEDGSCNAYKSEDGAHMCDYAQDNGCFQTYHDECFNKHECPAHKPKL